MSRNHSFQTVDALSGGCGDLSLMHQNASSAKRFDVSIYDYVVNKHKIGVVSEFERKQVLLCGCFQIYFKILRCVVHPLLRL